jgi:hypothetical protein
MRVPPSDIELSLSPGLTKKSPSDLAFDEE